ncbi:MAG: hypothetical protein FWD57_08565, partial [Polyangiaceae bacterium]|nr:hypothetical protein [Polyangiaceae bacterium]
YWKPRGVEFITAIFEDEDSNPATYSDIEWWGKKFKIEYPLVVDPRLSLGALFDKSASPFNMIVDTRTMTIVIAQEGLMETGKNNTLLQELARPE